MFHKLENIRRFAQVAEQGSLYAAAQQLGITQPALTRSIQLLEDACGAPLFDRHSRGLHLTPLGTRTLRHAKHILRECQLAETDLRSMIKGETGLLRIAAAPVWMSTILPGVIARLNERHPNLRIQLSALTEAQGRPGLHNGDLDLICGGFQDMDELPSFLVRRAFFRVDLKIVARSDHPIFKTPNDDLALLLQYPWISYQSDRAYLDLVMDSLFAHTGQRKPAAVQCDSMLTVLNLLQEGSYLAFLPGSFVDSVAGYDLRTFDRCETLETFASGIIYRRSLESNAAFQLFLDTVESRVAQCGLAGLKQDP